VEKKKYRIPFFGLWHLYNGKTMVYFEVQYIRVLCQYRFACSDKGVTK